MLIRKVVFCVAMLGIIAGSSYAIPIDGAESAGVADGKQIDIPQIAGPAGDGPIAIGLNDYTPQSPPPIPEPATLVLLGSGLAVLAMRKRKS